MMRQPDERDIAPHASEGLGLSILMPVSGCPFPDV
jgi:hypothetical protein